jgi:hypothetical protein
MKYISTGQLIGVYSDGTTLSQDVVIGILEIKHSEYYGYRRHNYVSLEAGEPLTKGAKLLFLLGHNVFIYKGITYRL